MTCPLQCGDSISAGLGAVDHMHPSYIVYARTEMIVSIVINVYFNVLSFRKYPDLFCQFKSLLGFKKPSTADLSPENTPPPPQFPTKDRVAEFAAEIGKYFKELLYVFQTVYLLFFCFPFSFQLKKYASEF